MNNYPNPVTKTCTQKILNQMSNSISKIKGKGKRFGICIFCYIKCNNKNIPVLMTNYEIINEKFLEENNCIKLRINNKLKTIEFGDTKYLNKDYDLSIIEIKEKKSDKIDFLEIDDYFYEKEAEMFYKKESLYMIYYNKKNDVMVSYAKLNYMNNSEIIFSSYRDFIPINTPILNLSTNKLIGIYKNTSKYLNKGISFKFIITEFINKYKYILNYKSDINSKNEIELIINISKNNINKKIYFFDNYEYYDDERNYHFHDNLKELNELNTELYINDNKNKYQKYFIPEKEGEYNIKIKFNINLTDCSFMFAGCKNITNIKFHSFNTNYVTSMKYMFYNCSNIKYINLYSFNTKNVTDMSNMFSICENLKYLDLSAFDTSNIIDMSWMFYSCGKLTYLDLSSFSTKNVINMSGIFSWCIKLRILDLSYFITNKVTNMSNMFYFCENLSKLNLSSFDTENLNIINILLIIFFSGI